MSKEGKIVEIAGQTFDMDLFAFLLMQFKDAFSHSSLTIEEAFKELDEYNLKVEAGRSREAYDYYQLLSTFKRAEISEIAKQIIVFKGSCYGVFSDNYTGEVKQTNKLYDSYFRFFDSEIPYYLKFDSNGELDKKATFASLSELFETLPQRETAYHNAYNMKKDNLDAFDYAMRLKSIGAKEIIEINKRVVMSNPDKVEGFKKTNNDVIGAYFTPTDKENVPTEIQKLLYEYNNNFGMEILNPNETGISVDERLRRLEQVFRREAIFHIRFERIHPFDDGNGRTGRIIMNYHLLRQRLAPVIITNVMSRDYKRCINENDIDGLTKMLLNSSSQQIMNWVSMKKLGLQVHMKDAPNNKELARLLGYDSEDENKKSLFKKLTSNVYF